MLLDLVPTRAGARLELAVSGELDLYTAPRLEEAVVVETSTGATEVVLELSGVTFVDSSGLSAIIKLHQRLEAEGASLALRTPSSFVVRLLDLTGVSGALTVLEE